MIKLICKNMKILWVATFLMVSCEREPPLDGFEYNYHFASKYTSARGGSDKDFIHLDIYLFEGRGCDTFRELKDLHEMDKFITISSDAELSQLDPYIFGEKSEEFDPSHLTIKDRRNKAFHILVNEGGDSLGYVILYGVKDKKGNQYAFLKCLVWRGSDWRQPASNLFKYLEEKGQQVKKKGP